MPKRTQHLPPEVHSRLKSAISSRDPRLSKRARIVLLAHQGKSDAEVAELLGLSRKTVWRWRTRFAQGGLSAIERERPRTGRKPKARERVAQLIIDTTLSPPPEGAARWSTRQVAKVLGVSRAMVHRVWREHGLPPAARQTRPPN